MTASWPHECGRGLVAALVLDLAICLTIIRRIEGNRSKSVMSGSVARRAGRSVRALM